MIDLRRGDCLELMKKIPDNSIDCIVTSPPYWKGFEYEAYFNSYKQYLDWCELWLKECKRVLKKNGTFWLNVINDSEITIRAFEILQIATIKIMFKLHDTIIWYRYNQQPANTDRQLTNQCEYIFMLRNTSSGVKLYKKNAYDHAPYIFKTKMLEMYGKFHLIKENLFQISEEKKQNLNGGIAVSPYYYQKLVFYFVLKKMTQC